MRREVVAQLEGEKAAQIRAIMSNGTYLETTEGIEARTKTMEEIAERFDDAIDFALGIAEPEDEFDLMSDPLMAAGLRGLEKAKWDAGLMGNEPITDMAI